MQDDDRAAAVVETPQDLVDQLPIGMSADPSEIARSVIGVTRPR